MKKLFSNGFTLIELLIVISIIGILVTFVAASYTGAQKQARDAQRKNDLSQYKIALENYAASNSGKYPCFGSPSANLYGINSGNYCSSGTTYSILNYLGGSCLFDPKNTGADNTCTSANNFKYCMTYNTAECVGTNGPFGTGYILYAELETGGWWVLCSSGKVGKLATTPVGGIVCPLP